MISNLIKTAAISGICLAASVSASLATSDWDEMQPAEYEQWLIEQGSRTKKEMDFYKGLVLFRSAFNHSCPYFVDATGDMIVGLKIWCSDKAKNTTYFEFKAVLQKAEKLD